MRGALVGGLALALACYAAPATGQQPGAKPTPAAREDASKMSMRSVTGTVKQTTEKGLIVVGRETGQKDKEWAFVLDADTRIEAGGKSATDLRQGDAVTVTYTNRDGKIAAQSVKVNTP
jgi:ribosomal protein S17